jgi:GPH family glycoside/pentoside/hexuronide:cation symporter
MHLVRRGRKCHASPTESLPLRTKILYSASSLGGEALSYSRGVWLVYYYAPPADADIERLLPLGLVGALLTAGRLLEAFDDALIGWWSDRTRSRLGRRLPFILGATPGWVLFAFLLFTPPEAGTAGTALYLFFILEAYYLFSTLSGGPYEALLPELATRSQDRVSIVGIRVYFGAAGGFIGAGASGLLVDHVGFAPMALAMSGLALVSRYAGMIGVWRRAKSSVATADIPFRQALGATFENRPFLFFLPTFVLFQTGLQLLLGSLPYFVNSVLGVEEEGTWVAALTATAIATVVVTIPLYARFAARTSKRHAYSTAMLGASGVFPVFAVVGLLPAIPTEAQVVIFMALAGLPIAGVYLFPAALMADICDYDNVRTGLRREGMYYGAQNLVEKIATSVGPGLLALLLLAGNTASDPTGIRLVGPAAGALVFVGFLLFRFYDLPDQVEVPLAPEPEAEPTQA